MTVQPNFVVNELLMYAVSKLDSDTTEDVVSVMHGFYGDETVNDAKAELWTRYGEQAALGKSISRRSKIKNVEDIVEALHKIDSTYPEREKLPVLFVAQRMKNLPPVTSGEERKTDQGLANRITVLESQMAEVLKSSAERYNIGTVSQPKTDHPVLRQTDVSHINGSAVRNGSERVVPSQNHQHRAAAYSDVVAMTKEPQQQNGPISQPHHRNNTNDWTMITRTARKRTTVYGKKQSTALGAPPRRYELVVFNVKSEYDGDMVKDYVISCGVEVINSKKISLGTNTNQMFKVDVPYDKKDVVMDADFWPENVGCRPFGAFHFMPVCESSRA